MFFLKRVISLLVPKTDLWSAAKSGHLKAIRQLLEAGADINAKKTTLNIEGDTLLHFAASNNQAEAAKVLVELGARVDSRNNLGMTPLMEAAFEGADETIEVLLACKANLNAQDRDGMTPLEHAVLGGREKTVAILLAKGANPNQESRGKKSNVLTRALEGKNRKIFKMLLDAGAEPLNSGDTPLSTAALYGYADCASLLLKAGADPNARNASGVPVILSAVRGKNVNILEFLIQAGAELNARNSAGETALDIAHDIKRKDIIQLLEKAGGKSGKELLTAPDPEGNGTFWQLPDDSVLSVAINPWPVKPGTVTLRASISPESPEQTSWKLFYRIISPDQSKEVWAAMFPVADSEGDDEFGFEASATIARNGKYQIQFRVEGVWGKEALELKDWDVHVI